MMVLIKKISLKLKQCNGMGSLGTLGTFMIAMLILMFVISSAPPLFAKLTIDTYAGELARTAEIAGRVGAETDARLAKLDSVKHLNPTVT